MFSEVEDQRACCDSPGANISHYARSHRESSSDTVVPTNRKAASDDARPSKAFLLLSNEVILRVSLSWDEGTVSRTRGSGELAPYSLGMYCSTPAVIATSMSSLYCPIL